MTVSLTCLTPLSDTRTRITQIVWSDHPVFFLARPFIAAGARQVVATLWRLIDAAGGEVSTSFFGRLYAPGGVRGGGGSVHALRAAMLEAIDYTLKDGTPIGRSPIFWAPFALTGDPR